MSRPAPERVVVAAALAAAGAATAGCSGLGNLPPFHEVETDLPGGLTVERAAFGLVEERRRPDGALEAAIRPLVVDLVDADGSSVRAYLPPLGAHTVSDIRRRTTVWPLFSTDSVGSDDERDRGESDDDTFFLPLVGWGGEPGQEPWWMVFPFYGHLRQKLFADEIEFAAFPLWARTHTGEWRSTHVLWPLIAWGDGEGWSHRRFLPFWSQTDGPESRKRTVAWPFVHWGTNRSGDRVFDGWFVFPLLGHRTSRDETFSEWTALWPFFQWSDDDATGDSYRAILWPIHKRSESRKGDEESLWWWPLYGRYRSPRETSSFYAWPIVWSAEYRDEGRTFRRTFVVPFWMERESGPPDGEPDRRELRSWPFFSFERTPDGEETVRVPEIVPFVGWRSGEMAWADLFALVRWRSDLEGRTSWDGPLGGIVRWRRGSDGASRLTLLWWLDIPTGDGR